MHEEQSATTTRPNSTIVVLGSVSLTPATITTSSSDHHSSLQPQYFFTSGTAVNSTSSLRDSNTIVIDGSQANIIVSNGSQMTVSSMPNVIMDIDNDGMFVDCTSTAGSATLTDVRSYTTTSQSPNATATIIVNTSAALPSHHSQTNINNNNSITTNNNIIAIENVSRGEATTLHIVNSKIDDIHVNNNNNNTSIVSATSVDQSFSDESIELSLKDAAFSIEDDDDENDDGTDNASQSKLKYSFSLFWITRIVVAAAESSAAARTRIQHTNGYNRRRRWRQKCIHAY